MIRTLRTASKIVAAISLLAGVHALGGCVVASSAQDEGASSTTESAVTRLPEAFCTRLAGVDDSRLEAHQLQIKQGGGFVLPATKTADDLKVWNFQQQVKALPGAGGYYTVVSGSTDHVWYAIDATHISSSSATSVVNANTAAPVSAGYYRCRYNWGDYYLPAGETRPYVPVDVIVYDPRPCTSC